MTTTKLFLRSIRQSADAVYDETPVTSPPRAGWTIDDDMSLISNLIDTLHDHWVTVDHKQIMAEFFLSMCKRGLTLSTMQNENARLQAGRLIQPGNRKDFQMIARNEAHSTANAEQLPSRYPIRSKFFANRIVRLLGKTCAAQEIGASGFCLVAWVAMTEDASGYRRAVTFYDAQLMPIFGMTSQKTLALARRKAVQAGWLHYEPGCKGRPGSYFTTIPEHADSLDDAPPDESHDEIRGESHVSEHRNAGRMVEMSPRWAVALLSGWSEKRS